MKFLNMDKVLCLSPHPDDTEISVAGTILKYQDTNFISAVCSIGSKGDCTSNFNRFDECDFFWRGVDNIQLQLLQTFITDLTEDEWITLIEDRYKENFDGIIIPSFIDSHQEHLMINRVGMALARNRKMTILEYRTPSTMDSWHPNLFINIRKTEEDKLMRMKTIVSQQKIYLTNDYLKASHIHLPTFKKDNNPVEQFKILEHHI